MPNSKPPAINEQAFVRALQQAVNEGNEHEAARLVTEHTMRLDAFLQRMMAQLEYLPSATLH